MIILGVTPARGGSKGIPRKDIKEIAGKSFPLIDYLQKDKDIGYFEDFDCPVLYQRLAVGSDGKIFCPNDEMGEYTFGDAHEVCGEG